MKKPASIIAISMICAAPAFAAPPITEHPPALMTIAPVAEDRTDTPFSGLDSAEIRSLTNEKGFLAVEGALQKDLEEARIAGEPASRRARARDLARFYAANQFHAEALAALRRIDPPLDDELRLLKAISLYAMARYDAALAELDDEAMLHNKDPRALMGKVKARLGAYVEAAKYFTNSEQAASPDIVDASYFLLRAQAALALGDLKNAEAALGAIDPSTLDANQHYERRYFQSILAGAMDDGGDGSTHLQSLKTTGVEPFASKAALALLRREINDNDLPPRAIALELQALKLKSDRDSFQRDLAWVRAETHEQAGEIMAMLEALRSIIVNHPASDRKKQAEAKIRATLKTLFDRDYGLSPVETAHVFYENIDYAPPGEDGDRLIREVAAKLVNLDLAEAAAEFLDHQVFKRLRGHERSEVAADLAALYLSIHRAGDSLRVLRSTRITGLSEKTNTRRRMLEARALEIVAGADEALLLLENAAPGPELALKADIHWRAERWAQAGDAYRAAYVVASAKAPQMHAFVRAGICYAMAGDDEKLSSLLNSARESDDGAPEFLMVQGLSAPTGEGAAARADPLLLFMKTYRGRYAEDRVKG